MARRPEPFLYVVGDTGPAPWTPTGGRRITLPRPALVALQAGAAIMVALVAAVLVTPETGAGLLALAIVAGGFAAIWVSVGRNAIRRPAGTRGALTRLATGAVAGALALAVLGDVGVWEVGPLDAVALAVLPFSAAVLVGRIPLAETARPRRVLVVGSGRVANHLVSSMTRARSAEVIGLVDDSPAPETTADLVPAPVGALADLPRLILENRVDLVLFTFLQRSDDELLDALEACRAAGAEVGVVSRLFGGLEGSLRLRRLEGYPVITARAKRGRQAAAALSRATDVVLAGSLMLLLSPLIAALALAIKIDSRGPVIFRCTRIGRGGTPFKMLKFRKMFDGATGSALTLADDDRFTRMGRFLARSKLDEVPQLWNVLIGDMSLVGPRPEDPTFVERFPDAYAPVLVVRPGIAGLSQLCFRREFEQLVDDDFETYYTDTLLPLKLSVDRYYVTHRSWVFDMRILIWTLVALTRGGEVDIDHLSSHVAFRSGARREDPAG